MISAEDKLRIEAAKKAIQNRDSTTTTTTIQSKDVESADTPRLVRPPAAQEDDVNEDNDGDNANTASTNEPGALSTVDIESLRPFASNPAKQERFERYIRFAELGHRGNWRVIISFRLQSRTWV